MGLGIDTGRSVRTSACFRVLPTRSKHGRCTGREDHEAVHVLPAAFLGIYSSYAY